MTRLDRRGVLRLGAALTAAGVAGCFADTGDDRSDHYEWAPADESTIVTAHVDLGIPESASKANELLPVILPSRDDAETAEYAPRISGLDEVDDPLLTVPIALGGRMLAATIGFYAAGLGYLVDPDGSQGGATDLYYVNGVVGVAGDLDVDRAVENLRSGTEGPVFQNAFERTGDRGGFELFESTSDGDGAVVAVDGSAAFMANDRRELVPVVDAASGASARAIEERDRFEWLAETAGEGHLSVGWIGAPDLEQFFWGNAEEQLSTEFAASRSSLFASVSFEPDGAQTTARLATEAVGDDARKRLESRLGTASDDHEFSVDGDRVSVVGTYASDVLDVEYTRRGDGGDDGQQIDPDEDPPPVVEETVPDDAFRFDYHESENRVDVHVEKSFAADELTVRAVESEWSSSVSPVEGVNYLTVYVDPEGDQVVVTVTVGDESGVVAAREFQ
ncbi:hypothetical protein GCM10028857_20210 [Salinarchaeum chitinilyticum]